MHAGLIQQAIAGLRDLVRPWPACGASSVLDSVDARLTTWASEGEDPSSQADRFIWSDHDRPLWQSFVAAWPRGQKVRRISIVSPFWSEEGTSGPLARLISALRERAPLDSDTEVHLLAEAFPVAREAFIPVLPETFATFDARQLGVKAFVSPVDPRVDKRDVDVEDFEGLRALHAKVVLIEGDTDTLAYVGSANFTRRGWGVSNSGVAESANIEAGLILRRANAAGLRDNLLPQTVGRPIPLEGAALGKFQNAATDLTEQPWPVFITEIALTPRTDDPRLLELRVTCDPSAESQAWSLQVSGDSYAAPETLHVQDGARPPDAVVRFDLDAVLLERILRERELEVLWGVPERSCRFPVNVDPAARDGLPVAPGGKHPGEPQLLAYYQGRIAWEDMYPEPGAGSDADAPAATDAQMVDTTRIQSYQIREFVEALRGIRDDLKTASQSGTSMRLSLRGPISPIALAKAIDDAVRNRKRTPVAACFQLVEILSILREAGDFAAPKYRDDWLASLVPARQEVEHLLSGLKEQHPSSFQGDSAFARYERAIIRSVPSSEEAT